MRSNSGMAASVAKSTAVLVGPCEPTPDGFLPLSAIDKLPTMRFWADTLHVFKHGQEPAKVIREAISKAMVYYYPLAGRLVEPDGDELQVNCSADGVWFVEAHASCRLEDVNYLRWPLMISAEDLLPNLELDDGQTGSVSLMIQVTEFWCGGFAVGTRYNHTMTDGVGLAQFMNAVGEMARGHTRPTTNPIWSREAIPTPVKPRENGSHQLLPPSDLNLENFIMDIPQEDINLLMKQAAKRTGTRCSTFELLGAKLWQSRIRAINLEPDVSVVFSFTANVRPLLRKVLPAAGAGYYGNCIYIANVTALSGWVANASIGEIASLIRDTKERLPEEFWKWANGELVQSPFDARNTYNMTHLVDWRHVGFSEVDYGWGPEVQSGAVTWSDFVAMGIITRSSGSMQGARLTARYVRKEHAEAFHEQIKNVSM